MFLDVDFTVHIFSLVADGRRINYPFQITTSEAFVQYKLCILRSTVCTTHSKQYDLRHLIQATLHVYIPPQSSQ
jgi:hypothetical protein